MFRGFDQHNIQLIEYYLLEYNLYTKEALRFIKNIAAVNLYYHISLSVFNIIFTLARSFISHYICTTYAHVFYELQLTFIFTFIAAK